MKLTTVPGPLRVGIASALVFGIPMGLYFNWSVDLNPLEGFLVPTLCGILFGTSAALYMRKRIGKDVVSIDYQDSARFLARLEREIRRIGYRPGAILGGRMVCKPSVRGGLLLDPITVEFGPDSASVTGPHIRVEALKLALPKREE